MFLNITSKYTFILFYCSLDLQFYVLWCLYYAIKNIGHRGTCLYFIKAIIIAFPRTLERYYHMVSDLLLVLYNS